jgi:hypothetical protein
MTVMFLAPCGVGASVTKEMVGERRLFLSDSFRQKHKQHQTGWDTFLARKKVGDINARSKKARTSNLNGLRGWGHFDIPCASARKAVGLT